MKAKKQQRLAREAEKTAKIQAQAESWRASVEPYFGYLVTKYSFRFIKVEAENWWVIRMIYQTDTTRVNIDFSIEFQRVEVHLDSLKAENPPYRCLLDNLLAVRARHLLRDLDKIRGLRDEQVKASLILLGQAVDEYASDILQGDFSIFPVIEEGNNRRVKLFRQREQEEETIPDVKLQIQFREIIRLTDHFCFLYLDDEYVDLCNQLTLNLCYQQPSPLSRGNSNTWACSIINALGVVNGLFDDSQTSSLSEDQLAEHFKLSPETMREKSKQIRNLLAMNATVPE